MEKPYVLTTVSRIILWETGYKRVGENSDEILGQYCLQNGMVLIREYRQI